MHIGHGAAIRRGLFIAVELGLSAAAVIYLVRRVNLSETREAIASANYWWLPAAAAFLLVDLALRAVRWRLLLSPQQGMRLSSLFGASNVGYLVNNILPLRAGEVARVLVVDELEDTGKIRAGSSIGVERGIDLMAMVALVVFLIPFVDEPSWARGPVLALGVGVVAAFCLLTLMARLHAGDRAFWRRRLQALPYVGGRVDEVFGHILTGFEPLMRPTLLVPIVVLTVIIWTCAAVSFFMVMRAFGLQGGFAAAALVLGATTLGMVVPSSPGYVGVFHAIAVGTLTEVFGVPRAEALSYAFAQHALIVVLPSVLAIAFLLQRREVLHDLVAMPRTALGEPPLLTRQLVAEPSSLEGGGVDA